MDKRAILDALRAELGAELARFTARALDAAAGATHEDNRAEGDKDMRATEASYIARGQAERVREIEATLARLASLELRAGGPAAASSIVFVVARGESRAETRATYFLVPVAGAGGKRLSVGGAAIQTLATTSPLGKALLGRDEGDDVEVTTPQGLRAYAIVGVE